jgi:ABC-type multidrug transport system ATPase subunit
MVTSAPPALAAPRPGVAAIDLRDVGKSFGATPALRGVSLRLSAGEVTLLAGPNGAGKTTLLALLGTQLSPSRGALAFLDAAGQKLPRREVRAELGWVGHESQCYAALSGRENIELSAALHGAPPGALAAVAERVGLERFADRPVGTLSRGQLQRVALARALVGRPSLLLLDEPWTGLDARSGQLLERVVREEAAAGALVVVVSHQEGLAERLGARRVELVRGLVTEDTPAPRGEAPDSRRLRC